MPDTAQAMILLWTAIFGGVIGSFLNVVIYRLPNGLSLIRPPSHCPKCKNPVRWFDNVPVFGWILLGGRCRYCRSPISSRYPLVEGFTAVMFAAVAAVEMPKLDVVYAVHMLLLCTLFCATLIEYDGHRPPWQLFIPAIIAGILSQSLGLWPALRPETVGTSDLPPNLSIGYGVIIAVVIIALLAVLRNDRALAPSLAAVAVGLGWWPFSLLVVLVFVQFLSRRVGGCLPQWLIRPHLAIGTLALAWILFGSRLVG